MTHPFRMICEINIREGGEAHKGKSNETHFGRRGGQEFSAK